MFFFYVRGMEKYDCKNIMTGDLQTDAINCDFSMFIEGFLAQMYIKSFLNFKVMYIADWSIAISLSIAPDVLFNDNMC